MTHFNRRDFSKLVGLLPALGVSSTTIAKVVPKERRFPPGFRWGCATAAYQIEGAVHEDGRGETIWDVFSHTPGKIKDGSNGDVACDSYHSYAEDTRLLKELGANSYRLSFAWSRFFPEGRGAVNQRGVDHYRRVIDNLLENRIEPYVTLFHWDLPTALPDGWQSRDTAQAFADYAGFVARTFGDRVRNFMTVNEIRSFIDIGHGQGRHAPGLKLPPRELNQARHHALLAHGLGTQAIRAAGRRDTRIGLAENVFNPVPVIETDEHIAAARKAFRVMNAPLILPILEGRYSDEYHRAQGTDAARVASGDMAAIGSALDFVGTNIYTGAYVAADESQPNGYRTTPGGRNYPIMGLPFLRVVPESGYWGIRHLVESGHAKAVYVCENGTVAADELAEGRIDDAERIMYLRNYIGHMQRAIAEGYPLEGYFLWSLLDNFEWADGYTARFGLYYTDFVTQKRTPKLSAAWFKALMARNVLV